MWKRYGYVWVTTGFFLFSLVGHWLFGWFAFVSDQAAHHQPVRLSEFFVLMGRDTLENWQSEFLQLIWQVAGLTYLLYVGSPQSKEGDDRMEAKMDHPACHRCVQWRSHDHGAGPAILPALTTESALGPCYSVCRSLMLRRGCIRHRECDGEGSLRAIDT